MNGLHTRREISLPDYLTTYGSGFILSCCVSLVPVVTTYTYTRRSNAIIMFREIRRKLNFAQVEIWYTYGQLYKTDSS
jgi:hypothetical protein